MSLRSASETVRIEAHRFVLDRHGMRHASTEHVLAARYLDLFGSAIDEALAPHACPRILILDPRPLNLRAYGAEAVRAGWNTQERGGSVLVAMGMDRPGDRPMPWRIGTAGDQTARSWGDFLDEFDGEPPDWVVADGDKAIVAAVARRWPTPKSTCRSGPDRPCRGVGRLGGVGAAGASVETGRVLTSGGFGDVERFGGAVTSRTSRGSRGPWRRSAQAISTRFSGRCCGASTLNDDHASMGNGRGSSTFAAVRRPWVRRRPPSVTERPGVRHPGCHGPLHGLGPPWSSSTMCGRTTDARFRMPLGGITDAQASRHTAWSVGANPPRLARGTCASTPMPPAHRTFMTRVSMGRAPSILLALAVEIGGASSPATAADADPAAAVQALFDAVDEGRFADVAGLECSAQRDEAARRLDLTDVMRDVPVPAQRSFVRLLNVSVSGIHTQILEDDGQQALVRVTAIITVSLNDDALARALLDLAWSGGIVDDSVRRSVLGQRIRERFASVPSPALVDDEVEVMRERGAWRVCGDLGWGIEALDPADVCSLLSPAELALLVAIPFVVRTRDGPGCTYAAADGSDQLSSVNVRLDAGSLDLIRSTFADGSATSVAGFDAYGAAGSLWVDLGGRLLTIQPSLIGAPEGADPQQLAEAIAEIVVPRIGR